jgi:hypothetical protein
MASSTVVAGCWARPDAGPARTRAPRRRWRARDRARARSRPAAATTAPSSSGHARESRPRSRAAPSGRWYRRRSGPAGTGARAPAPAPSADGARCANGAAACWRGWGEVDAGGPEIDVAAGGEVTLLPTRVLLLPVGRAYAASDHGPARPVSRRTAVADRPGASGPSSAARASPNWPVDTPFRYSQGNSSSTFRAWRRMIGGADHRQDCGGETDRCIGCGGAIAPPGPADLDGADPGLDLPLGRMAVAHHQPQQAADPSLQGPLSADSGGAPAALLIREFGMVGEERLDLGLDPPGSTGAGRPRAAPPAADRR